MDWFERITGFREADYERTQRQLEVNGRILRSRVNGKTYRIGEFELASLVDLRERVSTRPSKSGRLRVRVMQGDSRLLHRSPEFTGALFQVASQFNMLEMTSPDINPEHGVTRYEKDPTQGPACAIAAGAATIYRNYFVPTAGGTGQTRKCQLDGLHAIADVLRHVLQYPADSLWEMRNGYALCTEPGLRGISHGLHEAPSEVIDGLRSKLCIGLHHDVEVTDAPALPGPVVSQAFCSALPIAYSGVPIPHWRAFATLILEAAYEATLWAALDNTQRGGSPTVLVTSVGGGAFGNPTDWICSAIRRALRLFAEFDLDVRIVSLGMPSRELCALPRSIDEAPGVP